MLADAIETAALAPVLRRELARRRLLDFAEVMDAQFRRARHLQVIASALERLERREIRRLAITIPPRHGKTELVSRKFVAWYLGRNPSHQVILASYGSELAEGNSRAVRSMVEDEAYPFETALREDSRSVGRWETNKGGVLIASGVGSGLTGRGGHMIVCDDLVKDREAAESDAVRASTAAWFSDVLRTRAMPGAAIVMIGTRWHEDDQLGRIMREDGWEQIVLPLLAEDDDPLGRSPGELLWPERFSPDDIPSVERGEITSRSFAALYQQRPTPAVGGIFKRNWLTRRYSSLPKMKRAVVFVDCASKTGVANDRSAMALWGTDGIDYYLIDAWADRVEFFSLRARCIDFFERAKKRVPATSALLIEDASSGIALIQELKRSTTLPVIGVKATENKTVRAEAVTPIFESGRVALPESAIYLDAFIEEHAAFPGGRHDDFVDTTSGALQRLIATRSTTSFAFSYRH